MGMSHDDYCSCTPSEFWKIYELWSEQRDAMVKDEWDRTRMLCLSMVQPYSKKKLSGRDVFPLPWDKQDEEQPMSKQERKTRYEEAKKRYGIE